MSIDLATGDTNVTGKRYIKDHIPNIYEHLKKKFITNTNRKLEWKHNILAIHRVWKKMHDTSKV